ncbi:MAG: hypothetical protein ACRDFB_03585 [Rhabdochlamydiaceae bacterium]
MNYWLAGLLGITFTASSILARESYDEFLVEGEPAAQQPWFTGPILTPSGHVVPEKHQNYEPYVYWTQAKDNYNAHWSPQNTKIFNNILYQMTMQFGVLPNTEFDAAPQFVYNAMRGQHMWRVSDTPLTLAFQILHDHTDNWYPAIKLRFAANLPLGKYDHLKAARLVTDVGGIGTWYPSVGVVLTRLYHITGIQYLSYRLFINYSMGTSTNVKGLSVYGGAPSTTGVKGTLGTLYPGNIFLVLGGLEYSLSQNWGLALDLQYQHTNKQRFSGYSPLSTKPIAPSKELFALAPAIEYNWSANVGIIAGPWFTVAGRNTGKFISYVIALNVYN